MLFNHMREWRLRRSEDEGVPPYVVLTNRQLVAIVQKCPDSLIALGNVDGIGTGKVKRYGRQILEALHGAPVRSLASPAPGEAAAQNSVSAETVTVSSEVVA